MAGRSGPGLPVGGRKYYHQKWKHEVKTVPSIAEGNFSRVCQPTGSDGDHRRQLPERLTPAGGLKEPAVSVRLPANPEWSDWSLFLEVFPDRLSTLKGESV